MENSQMNNKTILITGGAGSIGRELIKELLKYDPHSIRVLDHSEYALYCLKEKIKDERLRCLLGDITDKNRVEMAMEGAQIVFHLAAIKHVDISEYNALDAVKINIIGTINILELAIKSPVLERFITISSDKAVEPISLYGATKYIQEKLTIWANSVQIGNRKFSAIRFGNVIDTDGSIVPKWTEQKKRGEPLTLTHPNMMRYYIPMETTIDFIIKIVKIMEGGDVFIPKMEEYSMLNLAKEISDNIAITSRRPGEKLKEKLYTEEEENRLKEKDGYWVIKSYINKKGDSIY